MNKNNAVENEIHPLINGRWSPRSFSNDKTIPEEVVASLFEAARWAPSSYNEQPWRYIYAFNDGSEGYQKLFSCLNQWNQSWAGKAGLLIMAIAKKDYNAKEGSNRHAMYDLGAANLALSLQALYKGLYVHQMGGYHHDKTTELFGIPENMEVVCFLAVGYKGEKETLPVDYQALENPKRDRFTWDSFAEKAE